VHPKDANTMSLSGLSFRDTLVGTEWVFPVPMQKQTEKTV